jgi:glyoxylase-like metal-dependent hydrolase (beta-lactamase superfamily II)
MRSALLWLLPAVLSLTPLAAHPRHRAPDTAAGAAKVHRVEKLSAHAYAIFGQGGNVGLFVTDRYAILVDDQYENIAAGLVEAIRSVTDRPIRYLVNTHAHPDHVGANVVMEKQVMAIVAHANVRHRMVTAQAKLEPAKRGGLPELSFGEEDAKVRARLDINLDGAEFHLLHAGPGHTDGDLMLGYPAELIMHMGDLFFNGLLPYVDTDSGGSFDGLVAQIDHLASWIPEGVKLIPGHGPIAAKKDLLRYRDLLKAVQAHAKANPAATPAALAASFEVKAWPDYKVLEGFVTWETLFAVASGKGPGRVVKS